MPYSNPLSAAKILRVADSHVRPMAKITKYSTSIGHAQAQGKAQLSLKLLKSTQPHKLQGNKEAARVKERTRGDLNASGLQKEACGKTWQGEKTWADSVRRGDRKQAGNHSVEKRELKSSSLS